jgi:[acyl-carrier-protein] S-malonyltransferase
VPRVPTALLFPGQGAQKVGMGADLYEKSAAARAIFALADAVCGRPISRICFEGPEEQLRPTDVAQPALLAVELALLAALGEVLGGDLLAALDVRWVAGHSLGEYGACAATGALSSEDALRLAAERGRLMGQAPAGTMAAVLGLDASALVPICAAIPGVVVANDNAPGQVVLSGEVEAVQRASQAATAAGARRVIPLNVAGAFHSPLMAAAAAEFARILADVQVSTPRLPIIGNVSAGPLTDAGALRAELAGQVAAPVRWRESVTFLADAGAQAAVECGPGNVLTGMAKRTAPSIAVRAVGSWDDVEAVARERCAAR